MQSEADTTQGVRREFLWRFSKYLLHDSDLGWARDHLSDLRRVSVEPMFPVLRYVWNHLEPNTVRLAEVCPELAPLAEAVARYCAFHRADHDRTIAAQNELLDEFAGNDVWPLVIKGAAMRAYTTVSQAMTDLDVVARDLDETWSVIEIAERLGYPLKKIKVRYLSPAVGAPGYHGYGNLYRCEDGGEYVQGHWDLGRVRTLDLHFGRFYGPGEGVLVTDLWARARRLKVGGTEALVPSLEDMVLVEVLHLVRHGSLSMGTVNRVCQLVADDRLDRTYVAAELRRNDLEPMAHAVLTAIVDSYPHAREAADRLRQLLRPAPVWLRQAIRQVAAIRRVERYGAGSAASVCLQARYVFDAERHQRRLAVPLVPAVVGFARMYRNRRIYPRAHARWRRRRLGWVSASRSAVMLTRLDRTSWSPAGGWDTVGDTGSVGAAVRVGRRTLVLDSGTETETVLTPIGAFTSSGYDGLLSPDDERRCVARARRFRAAHDGEAATGVY
jgi:Uncharacterised nucleotidyltransferase